MNAIAQHLPMTGLTRTRIPAVRLPLMIAGLSLLAVFGVDTALATSYHYLPVDVPVTRFIQSVAVGPFLWLFTIIDELEGVKQQAVAVAILIILTLLNWRNFPLVILSALSGPLYTLTLLLIQRPRPSAELVHVIRHTNSASYPSGHVAFFATYLTLLVTCLAIGRLPASAVRILWVLEGFILVVVCLGRVYLGEHWPSDVVGGLALGLGWTLLVMSIGRISSPSLDRK